MADPIRISLDDILPDPYQPRQFFDPLFLEELSQSIKVYDVLQPITVRPIGSKYMIIFGEQRWRSSKMVMNEFPDRNTVPAYIRNVSATEAFEMQVIENLQRKDVNPMEEASSFKILITKYDVGQIGQKKAIEEIGQRVGKPPSYVAQRMKLCDLTKDWQDILLANKMKLGLAYKLARLQQKDQKEIYKEARIPKDWQRKKDWELSESVSVDAHEQELNKAPFKLDDAKLYPEAGPCTTCQHNSNFNKLLFPDLQKKKICHNGVCFSIKCSKAYQNTIEDAMMDPDMLFVCTNSYLDKEAKKRIKTAEDLGAKVLMDDMFDEINEPESPETWEDFFNSQKEDFEWDELSESEQNELETDWKDEFENDVAEYKVELFEYNQAIASGQLKKAFVVAGYNNVGNFIHVRIKVKKGLSKGSDQTDNSDSAIIYIDAEITAINDHEKRQKELDREKVYKKFLPLVKDDDNSFLVNDKKLSADECAAFLFTLSENSSNVKDFLLKQFNIKEDWLGLDLYNAIRSGQTAEILQKSMRIIVHHKLINQNETDFGKRGKPAAMYNIGKQYFPNELQKFEKDQAVKTKKRVGIVAKKLEALEEKKGEALEQRTVVKEVVDMEPELA